VVRLSNDSNLAGAQGVSDIPRCFMYEEALYSEALAKNLGRLPCFEGVGSNAPQIRCLRKLAAACSEWITLINIYHELWLNHPMVGLFGIVQHDLGMDQYLLIPFLVG
jgi:hypothetical protein